MKKFTFILMMMLAFAGFTMAQTIEDFECIKMNMFSQGSADPAIPVVANPDTVGNHSLYVGKFLRSKDGDPWQGWYATMPNPINVTTNRYVHIKVWKPRVSPTCFKVEGGAGNSGDVFPMTEYSKVGHWEDVVYDMGATAATGDYVKIVFIPDFLNPVNLLENITIYFDDMYANNDPTPGSAPVQMMENFETIPLNMMAGGDTDLSSMTLVSNPDKSGVNLSDYAIKFLRDKDGVPWGGFWSKLPATIDVTTNKFVHVKVWKSRISPLKFKIEGGTAGNLEIGSKYPQTKINAWEDIVFDFTDKTGTYPIIAFMPDFADPVNLTEDMVIYFDDFILNNDSKPLTPPEQKISIDMRTAGMVAGDKVYITGAIGGIHGTWATPGDNPNNEMFDTDGDGIYSIYMHLPNQVIEFKFVKNTGWTNEDPLKKNRPLTITGNLNLVYTWGLDGAIVSNKENKLAGKIEMYPNPVRNELKVNSTVDVNRVIITNTLGKVVSNTLFTNNKTISTSTLSKGMYFVTFVDRDGNKATQKLIKD